MKCKTLNHRDKGMNRPEEEPCKEGKCRVKNKKKRITPTFHRGRKKIFFRHHRKSNIDNIKTRPKFNY